MVQSDPGDVIDRNASRARRRSDSAAKPLGFTDLAASPFRADRDRVAGSPFFSRLGGVTQVVSPSGSGLLLHNRLTHSLKVAQVARAIAERLTGDVGNAATLADLGGCDLDAVEAAALGHDLGHPPFGHLGEQVLDRLARSRFGLVDGFEGNAQSFRIVTSTDVRGATSTGLDLTAAVRASLLKYPWTRLSRPRPHPRHLDVPPRGAAEPTDMPGTGSAKFSCYVTELDDFRESRAPFADLVAPWQQTVEATVMDTADDIAYAIHDLEDFYRVGVLQHATVSAELSAWRSERRRLAGWTAADVGAEERRPGRSLELLRRRMQDKDSWIFSDEAFGDAVDRVHSQLVDGLLSVPFDRSMDADQAVAEFSARWMGRLVDGMSVTKQPGMRAGHVLLGTVQWHEVQVLKFVNQHFVLLRPDLALQQRGQARLLTRLVEALDAWLTDRVEEAQLPRRLRDLVELAESEYTALAEHDPDVLTGPGGHHPSDADELHTLARGRAVIDFVSSLTDAQAASLMEALNGHTTQMWADTFVI